MKEFDFYYSGKSIIVEGKIQIKQRTRKKKMMKVRILVDTGAERTSVSLNLMNFLGYAGSLVEGLVVSTANQNMEAYTVVLKSMEVFDEVLVQHEVIAHEISYKMPFEVILGMDFFEGKEFCIDTIHQKIKFHE